MNDGVLDAIYLDIASKVGVSSTAVNTVVDSFYKDITKVVASDDTRTIKIDYFGKLVYNPKMKGKSVEDETI